MNPKQTLRRVRRWTLFFIVGLVLSGATAIPLVTELNWLAKLTGARALLETPASTNAPAWAAWLVKVQATLQEIDNKHPILFYGTAGWPSGISSLPLHSSARCGIRFAMRGFTISG